MSIKVQGQIWERLNCDGRSLVLALALADSADDNGDRIYPSIGYLAYKTRQSERQVQRQLKRFREVGWLQCKKISAGGRNKTTRYRINPAWIKGDSLTPFPDRESRERVTPRVETVTPQVINGDIAMSPDPSLSIQNLRSARANPKGARAPDVESRQRRIRDYLHRLEKTSYGRHAATIASLAQATVEEVQRELDQMKAG